jgi:hypothetical protein
MKVINKEHFTCP